MTGMSVLTDAILATLKAFAGDRLLKGLEDKREWETCASTETDISNVQQLRFSGRQR